MTDHTQGAPAPESSTRDPFNELLGLPDAQGGGRHVLEEPKGPEIRCPVQAIAAFHALRLPKMVEPTRLEEATVTTLEAVASMLSEGNTVSNIAAMARTAWTAAVSGECDGEDLAAAIWGLSEMAELAAEGAHVLAEAEWALRMHREAEEAQ